MEHPDQVENSAGGHNVDWRPDDDKYPSGLRDPRWAGEIERLRAEYPVAYSDRFGGFWTLTRYEDVTRAAVDYKTFRSGRQFLRMPDLLTIPGILNPPEHSRFRRWLNGFFAEDRLVAMGPHIERFVSEQLDPLLSHGSGDAVREFCQPFPARVLAKFLNLGEEAYKELLAQFAEFEEMGWDSDAINEKIVTVFAEHISRLVEERRKEPLDPATDLISGALELEVDGALISDETVVAIGVSVIGAGHSTTADALSSMVFRLATDPYLQSRLRREPELVPSAVEEFVRIDAPLPELTRTTTKDVEIGGVTIPEGSLIALNFGAANLDPHEFEYPQACIIDRPKNRHLGFGHGVHKCVGAPLARLELKTALIELLKRTQEIELDGPPRGAKGLVLKGFSSLPVRVVPAAGQH